MIGFCTHFAPLFYQYSYDPLIDIDNDIDIFQNVLVDIDIDINIFQNLLSIFFKSVDISTINIRYRYIEQG